MYIMQLHVFCKGFNLYIRLVLFIQVIFLFNVQWTARYIGHFFYKVRKLRQSIPPAHVFEQVDHFPAFQ